MLGRDPTYRTVFKSREIGSNSTPHRTPKNQSSPGRGGKTFEKHDVFRERAMDGESVFYHPVLEKFGSNTDLARRWIIVQLQFLSINEIMLGYNPTYFKKDKP